MRWLAQVGHVAAKDLRYTLGSIVALVAAAALAAYGFVTHNALGPIVRSNTETLSMSEVTVTWLPILIFLIGIIAVATLVQADRPLQADSFWTTRPLSPTAVLVAKLLLTVTAVTLPPLAAALMSLRALHTPNGVAASVLAHASIIHLSLLLATVVIASLTEDVKGFVTATVAVLGLFLATFGLIDAMLPNDFNLPSGFVVVAMVSAVLILTFLYRGRMAGTGRRVVGLAVALLLLLGATEAPTFDVSTVPTVATGPRLSLTFGAPGQTSMIMPFMVHIDGRPSMRYAFARDLTVISGEHDTEQLTLPRDTLVVGPQFPDLGRTIRWGTPAFSFPAMGQLVTSPADSHTVARGATAAELSGTVTVLRPQVLAILPLRDGAVAEKGGRFVSIYGLSHDSARIAVYVHTVNPPATGRHQLQFAVVNFARGEGSLLDNHPSSTSGDGWIVLPWIRVSSSFDQFSTNSQTLVPADSSWYAGASLVAVEWVPVERYHTSATMRLR